MNNQTEETGKAVQTAVITGAGSGIGLACAQRFAEKGWAVIGLDLNMPDNWSAISQGAPASDFHRVDVTDASLLNACAKDIIEKYGNIDTLITAAGVGDGGPVHLLEEEVFDRVLQVNLKGTYLSIKAFLEPMIRQRSGSIITIASVEGINGTEGGSAYNASKGAVVLLTKNIAMDYGKIGIRCNAICPGFIDTPMLRKAFENLADFKTDVLRQIKLGRFGQADDIAASAWFLASKEASYITGQSIVVDGGYTAGHSHGIVELMGLV